MLTSLLLHFVLQSSSCVMKCVTPVVCAREMDESGDPGAALAANLIEKGKSSLNSKLSTEISSRFNALLEACNVYFKEVTHLFEHLKLICVMLPAKGVFKMYSH